jgi:3'-phosphoadenosine 5'-phosphosulfate sulfotransferase (PAPS reductase)/FAD synthetase
MTDFPTVPNLASYDLIVVNTSGGKDSQTMMHVLHSQAVQLGIADRLVAVHADLGRAEWAGTGELVAEQAAAYGMRLEVVSRPQGDLVQQIEDRGMFPSSSARYCTSDQKRGQVSRVITALVAELGLDRPARVLNCQGIRAQESPARAKKAAYANDKRQTNGRRVVDTWYPIFTWTEDEVWASIQETGIRHHVAYDYGMPRLSCAFCVMAGRDALVLSAKLNPELAVEYAELEERIGHTIQNGTNMREIIAAAQCGAAPTKIEGWVC